MGAEIGATTSLFAYDDAMGRYLKATGRDDIAEAADAVAADLRADDEVLADPERFFDQVIEIDLVHPRAAHQRPPHPRPAPARSASSAPRPRPRAGRSRSPRPSSARAPTPPTRTSAGPPRSPAGPPTTACGAKVPLLDHPRLRAGARHHRARRPARRPRGRSAPPCWPTPAAPASASGRAATCRRATPTHRHLVQPQLPEAQRRLRLHPRLRDLARDGRGPGAGRHGSTSTPLADTLTNADGEQVRTRRAGRRGAPRQGLHPRRERLPRSRRPTARGVAVKVSPDLRPPPAARALRRLGRQGLHRPAHPHEGQGQVHHRPHLGGRPVAEVPRPPREHLGQPLHRRGQRLHRRGRSGQGPARRHHQELPRHRQAATTRPASPGSPSATRTTARAAPASTPPWSPASAAPRSSSCAASPASTRPTSRSRACCRSPSPTRPSTT